MCVLRTFLLSFFERESLYQHALPLIAFPRPAITDYYRNAAAVFARPPRQSRITGRKELEVIEQGSFLLMEAGEPRCLSCARLVNSPIPQSTSIAET